MLYLNPCQKAFIIYICVEKKKANCLDNQRSKPFHVRWNGQKRRKQVLLVCYLTYQFNRYQQRWNRLRTVSFIYPKY